jgi:hypothetical protein
LKAVRSAVSQEFGDPHEILGRGGPRDVLVAGRLAVRDAVLERIEALGCCGRAAHVAASLRDADYGLGEAGPRVREN